ncbi:MAG TPA: hypothetical protein VLR54_07000 [Methanobacteriaceae archaeon]|nr:hypothetical protein [Methanobacteriaceae archaeon]
MDYKTVAIAVMAVIVVLLAGVNAVFLMNPDDNNSTDTLSLSNNTTTNLTYSNNNTSFEEEPTHKVVKTNTTKKHNSTKTNGTGGNTTVETGGNGGNGGNY